jgi:hypothetical protein
MSLFWGDACYIGLRITPCTFPAPCYNSQQLGETPEISHDTLNHYLERLALIVCTVKIGWRRYLFPAYKILLFCLSVLVLTRDTIFRMPGTGLDPSYNLGLNLAIANDFTFGKDIVFNYGPLAYLHTRLPIAVSRTEYLLWDTFFLLIVGFALFYSYRNLNSFWAASMAGGAILIYSRSAPSLEGLLILFLFLLFHHLQHGSITSLILASTISIILFYAKINLGMVAVSLTLLYLLYQFFFSRSHSRRFVSIYAAFFLGSIFVLGPILSTELPGYVQGSLHLIYAYNDAMFIYRKTNPYAVPATYLALVGIAPFLLVFGLNLRSIARNSASLLRFAFITIYIFILFKYSFVRADEHMIYFFQTIPLAFGLVALFSTKPVSTQLAGVMGLAMILSLPVATRIYNIKEFSTTASGFPVREFVGGISNHIVTKTEGINQYLSQAVDPEFDLSWTPLSDNKLPDRFLDRIGDQGVDVVTWEISYIYSNQLTYNPRPVIQSYQAYNDYLDSLNRDKYNSAESPEFILFENQTINNQHPTFIESKTRLAMLANYQYVDLDDDLMLLQKRAEPLDYVEVSTTGGTSRLNEEIPLKQTDDLLMMSFDIQYSLPGKLMRTLYQPPPLYVTVTFDNGDQETFKAIKSVVNGEVQVNKFFKKTGQAVSFFGGPGTPDKEAVSIRFHSPEAWGFVPNFSYAIKSIVFETNTTSSN